MSERSRNDSSSSHSNQKSESTRGDKLSSQRNSNASISQSKKNQFDPGGSKKDDGMDQVKSNLPLDKTPEEKGKTKETIEDSHGKNSQPVRLLLVSNKIKNHGPVVNAVLPHVKLVQYKYETVKLETIKSDISQALDGKMAASIACVLHTKPGTILLCSSGDCREVSYGSIDRFLKFINKKENNIKDCSYFTKLRVINYIMKIELFSY